MSLFTTTITFDIFSLSTLLHSHLVRLDLSLSLNCRLCNLAYLPLFFSQLCFSCIFSRTPVPCYFSRAVPHWDLTFHAESHSWSFHYDVPSFHLSRPVPFVMVISSGCSVVCVYPGRNGYSRSIWYVLLNYFVFVTF